MRIIVVGTAHPYRGGLAAFNERISKQFAAEGETVEVVTFTLQYPAFLFPGKTQFSDDAAPTEFPISRKVNSCNPFNWISVGRWLAEQKPDVVLFAYWMSFMAPCFGTIARVAKCKSPMTKMVALVHNMIPHEPNILDKLFPSYFVNAMDGFVALSNSVVDDIAKFDKKSKPKCFSPHPIYDHYGECLERGEALRLLSLDEDCRYILFFGFIRAYKGLDLLLAAMADERLKSKPVKLIVAGEFYGDAEPYLKQVRDLGLEQTVIFRSDYIPNDEVNRYFSAADIVAQPYKTATQSGVSQVAFHFEKPMVVTNVGGLAEIVPDGKVGYVVEPNPSAIADALVAFFEKGLGDDFHQNMKTEKLKYAWSKMTDAVRGVSSDVACRTSEISHKK